MTTTSPKAYPGDLTEAQAELLLPLIPPPKPGGRPRSVNILSVLQSVKTATMINQEVGYDAGKQIKGRKRFTLVDTFG